MSHGPCNAYLRSRAGGPQARPSSLIGRLFALALLAIAALGLLPSAGALAGGRDPCAGRQPCDLGGQFVLAQYVPERHAAGTHQIAGVCYSRCTLDLIAGACVWPNAELGFHAVRNSSGEIDKVATMMVESLYPLGIRNWIRRTGAMNSGNIATLSGAQAIQLGVPACRRMLSAN
jgi:hypothetical protein